MKPSGDYLLLVDGSSFIHRNYHALPRLTRRSDGLQTGALYGFANSMMKMFWLNWTAIGRLPTHGAVILDTRGPNWRHEIFPAYKQQRKPYEPELLEQLPYIPEIAAAFNVSSIGVAGYEADDLIATYARLAADDGLDVVIASSDKDLSQLVYTSGTPITFMYDQMKDKGQDNCADAMIDEEAVFKRHGVWPDQIADMLALTGDSVDNVPGVAGVGPKTAAKILSGFPSLDAALDAAEWGDGVEIFGTEKIMTAVGDAVRTVAMSRKLVALDDNVPVERGIDDLRLESAAPYVIRGVMMDFEFASLVERVDRPKRNDGGG